MKRNGSGTQLWLPVVSDGQGQLIAIADSGGQLNGTLTGPQYDAGLWNSSGLTSNSHSFNPRRWSTPGGIDTISTFRSRQYDPTTGKWLQEDPIGIAGGVNLYGYNGNDPNSFSDPFGLCPICAAAVVVAEEALEGAVTGAVIGAGEQIAENKLRGQPLLSGVGSAAKTGAVAGAVTAGVGTALRIGRALGLARSATGAESMVMGSRAEAEAVGKLHVGSNVETMFERSTGEVRGIRNPTTGAKFRPEIGKSHVNLENAHGGNLHLWFSQP